MVFVFIVVKVVYWIDVEFGCVCGLVVVIVCGECIVEVCDGGVVLVGVRLIDLGDVILLFGLIDVYVYFIFDFIIGIGNYY